MKALNINRETPGSFLLGDPELVQTFKVHECTHIISRRNGAELTYVAELVQLLNVNGSIYEEYVRLIP